MNTTCYMLLNPLWNLTVILIVMSSFMFIASFAACCLHIRHIHIKEMSSTYEVAKGGEVVTKD